MAVQLPQEYGYVLATTGASLLVATWHGARIGSFRKAAGIPYPQAYAEVSQAKESKAAYVFNCAQRAHGQFLENYPVWLVSLLLSGLQYPRTAAGLGLMWLAGRVVYAVGYTDPNKDKGQGRLRGVFYALAQVSLIVLSGKVSYDVAMAA